MKRLALLLMLFTQLSSVLAFGQFAIRLEIENELEQKATRVLRSYDPHAVARVSVQLKKVNAVLPGTDSVIENLVETKSKNVLSEQDIESVSVTVTYAETRLQEIAASSLQSALGLKAGQIKIDWKPFEPSALQNLKNQDTGSQIERLLLDLKQLIWVVAVSLKKLSVVGLGCAVFLHH